MNRNLSIYWIAFAVGFLSGLCIALWFESTFDFKIVKNGGENGEFKSSGTNWNLSNAGSV